MNTFQPTVEIAADIESRAYTLSKRGYEPFVLCCALLTNILRGEEYEEVESMASGDEDTLGLLIDREQLGNFVFEHVLEDFQEIARMELNERQENAKTAWEVEIEYRDMVRGNAK